MSFLTRQQAMEYLHICNKKMWKLTSARKIPFYQDTPGGKMLFDEADLKLYLGSIKKAAPQSNPYTTIRKRRTA